MNARSYLRAIDDLVLKALGPKWLVNRQPLGIAKDLEWFLRNVDGSGRTILDLGCGGGAVCFALAIAGHTVTGIDLERSARNLARRYSMTQGRMPGTIASIPWDLRRLDECGLPSEFDCVIASEVIEHIMDDEKFVRDLAKLIRPGGILLLATPYKLYHRLVADRLSDWEDGGHVRWGYTEEDLRGLLEPNGLRIEKVTYISGWVTQLLINLGRYAQQVFPFGELAVMVGAYPLRVFTFCDKMIPYAPLAIAVKARKEC